MGYILVPYVYFYRSRIRRCLVRKRFKYLINNRFFYKITWSSFSFEIIFNIIYSLIIIVKFCTESNLAIILFSYHPLGLRTYYIYVHVFIIFYMGI